MKFFYDAQSADTGAENNQILCHICTSISSCTSELTVYKARWCDAHLNGAAAGFHLAPVHA
jgi:hypothetical protein